MKLIILLACLSVLQASGPAGMVDSLILAGRGRLAETELLSLLREDRVPDDVILFRLVGIMHGSGREDRCLQLLDSLELAGGGDLLGWKVSLLDLSRRPEEALELVPADNPLLRLWLQRDSDDIPLPDILPAPDCLAERAVRAMVCTDGRMSKGQVEQTVMDAVFLPFLADEVLTELEVAMKSEGPWWDLTAAELASVHSGYRLQLLLAERDLHLARGSEEEWEVRLEAGEKVSLTAARVLLRMNPGRWGRSWRIADILSEGGAPGEADSMAAAFGGEVFAAGVTMATMRERGRYSELIQLCDSLSPAMPDSLLARGALFGARAERALSRPPGEYHSSYLEFATLYPWHPKASEAAYLAARYYDSERNWPLAADAYMAALAAGSSGEARAHWRGGFCHYMCGRGAVGDSIWAAGTEKYPFSAWCDEMLFWRARYAGRTGDTPAEESLLAETARRHPWEFYGLLAAERTGSGARHMEMADIDLASGPVTAMAVDMMSRGYGSMASDMLYRTAAADAGIRGAALALMGEHRKSLEVLRSLDYSLRSGNAGILPDSLLRFYFPAPYRELTQTTVSGMGLPAELVTGLMRQESYFSRWARSWVGASGLIQLMPGTAGDVARWYGLPPLSGEELFDPASSILYGSLYLARQYSAFDGSPVLALSAYNAGPGNASRWREAFPPDDDDPELFIEQIPMTETRGYVKHVMANSWIYGELFR